MSSFRSKLVLSVPGLLLAAFAAHLMMEAPSSERLFKAAIVAVAVVLIWTVAVQVKIRYPERPLGTLLFLLAIVFVAQAMVTSLNSYVYTIARAARPIIEVLLIWIMLAFPSGKLQRPRERWLVILSLFAVTLLWLPGIMLSPSIPMFDRALVCRPDCPRNVLFLMDRPELSQVLLLIFRAVGSVLLIATAVLLALRLKQATPLMRRILMPVLVVSIARALCIAAFVAVDNSISFIVTITTFCAIPLAMAFGLLRGRLYLARALQRLVKGMKEHSDIHSLKNLISSALDDPTLSVSLWLQESEHWVDGDGRIVTLDYPYSHGNRAVTIVTDSQRKPVAALTHDLALLEEPMLIDAVADSMLMVLESHRLESELKNSMVHVFSAVEKERSRIESDLHDGAQQRLIALRTKVSVIGRLLENDVDRARRLFKDLDEDIEKTIRELRTYAHGIMPPLLVERGLPDALRELAGRCALSVQVNCEELGRFDANIENALYFCCSEALQNVAKHAGEHAVVMLSLWRSGANLCLLVKDDVISGTTNVPSTEFSEGKGLNTMQQRMASVGGSIRFESSDTGGFTVNASVPVDRFVV